MTLAIQVRGQTFTDAVAIEVHRSLGECCGFFTLDATANERQVLPFGVGALVKIVTESNTAVMTGFVETLEVSQDESSHTIRLAGRDRTCDLVDSSAPGAKRYQGPISLVSVIKQVLADLSLNTIQVFTEVSLPDLADHEMVSAEIGQGAYDFLESYARRQQVLIVTNGDGNLIITRAGAARLSAQLVRSSTFDTNVKASRLTLDSTQRYRRYVVRSQIAPAFVDGEPETLVDQLGEASDSSARASRILEMDSEAAMTSDDARARAAFEAATRRGKSLTYSAVVQGHELAPGVPWPINRLVSVRDELAQIQDTLLIKGIRMAWDLNEGSTTTIECTVKDAYTPEPPQPNPNAPANPFVDAAG